MTASRIHHVNFVVEDLEEAMPRFESMLGLAPFEVFDHAARGARVARSALGDSWFVLVCPYDSDSVPGQFLTKNGEGFFLLSLTVDAELPWRDGILDWRVHDVGEIGGALFQFTESDRES